MIVMDPNLMNVGLAQGVEEVSRLAATSFVSGLWQGPLLVAVAGITLRMVPKTTAAIRFSIWTAVFAVLALLPLIHASLLRTSSGTAGSSAMVQVDVRWSFAIAGLWLVASLIRAAELMVSVIRLRGIWKRATPVEANFGAMSSAAGERNVQVCTSADVDQPSVIGFFSPRILLPSELYARLTAAELEQIVLHEAGHLRRADDWMNLLQKLSLVVVPLNPVLIWIERRLCLERELACDDDVLSRTGSPKAYATCLTNLAEHRLNRPVAALSLGAWERQSELARRVHSILQHGEKMGRTRARVVIGGLMLVLLSSAAGLSRCPQFISFSRADLPVLVAAGSLPSAARYQPAMFHDEGASRETMLKTSMPMNSLNHQATQTLSRPSSKRHRPASANVLLRTRPQRPRVQQFVVLTSWAASEHAGMLLTVSGEREFSSSYAAVPTPSGWLVIQL
jgi:beta-lactamase regulating signal transducer with metallopeptidase domain